MRAAPEKTRHAVQMAIAARALARTASYAHRKRVVARYAFVYLDDVIKFAAPWRNRLRRSDATLAAADSALPALKRLRRDWRHYQHVRDYIAAKRQPRNPSDPVANEIESFELWADIGALSVDTLVDDAAELHAQLAAVTPLPPVEFDPVCSDSVRVALDSLDAVGEEGSIEIAASSFGSDRPGAFPIRMGGAIGRLVPLMNDVAENLQTLQALITPTAGQPVFEELLRCQLPAELYELLRLAIGPEDGAPPSSQASLLGLYRQPRMSPPARERLEGLQDWISRSLDRAELRDWRNRLGAHIDEESSWAELADGISGIDLAPISRVIDITLEQLECSALEPHGPLTLLFPARKLRSLMLSAPQPGLSYDDPDAAAAPASALPPAGFQDAHYMVWTSGGPYMSAAVAGINAARARELAERIEHREKRERTPSEITPGP